MVSGGRSGSGILLEANIPRRTKTSKGRNRDFRPRTIKNKRSAQENTVKIKTKMTGSGET
jgi:hypothetical protein